jgi:hypothetical protein
MQPNNVIRPAAFDRDSLGEHDQILGLVPQQQPLDDESAPDALAMVGSGVQLVTDFLYDHRTAIRNTLFLAGGTFLVIKGPPIVARSFSETMHYLREGWFGRGYDGSRGDGEK